MLWFPGNILFAPELQLSKSWVWLLVVNRLLKKDPIHTHTHILTLVCLYVCRTETYFIKWDPPALHECILIFFLYCIYFFFLLLLFFFPYPFLSPSSSFSFCLYFYLSLFYRSLGSMNGLLLLFFFFSQKHCLRRDHEISKYLRAYILSPFRNFGKLIVTSKSFFVLYFQEYR